MPETLHWKQPFPSTSTYFLHTGPRNGSNSSFALVVRAHGVSRRGNSNCIKEKEVLV